MKSKKFSFSVAIAIVLSLGFVSTQTFAATQSGKARVNSKKSSNTRQKAPALAPVATAPSSSAPLDIRFAATVGVGIDDGNFGFGAGFRADLPVNLEQLRLRVGGETGIYRFSVTGGSFLVFPIAVTGQYVIEGTTLPFKPYVRAAIGIDIVSFSTDASASVTLPNGQVVSSSASSSSTEFHFVVSPGAMIPETQFFAELPLGAFAGGFLIMPTVGYQF